MASQIFFAAIAVIIGVGVCALYFYGANWVLERYTEPRGTPEDADRLGRRDTIQPYIFVVPALALLGIYLVYPVVQTSILTLYNSTGQEFVGLANYAWAYRDADFLLSIRNNVLWLIIVPAMVTSMGLIIATLADKVWWGNIAKSLIFMPMAISFVGASVIWKFVYDYRGPDAEQIGALNALVVAFGLAPQAWITLPFWNNLFLMVILVWIQTGFAMVILGAALRGVPEDTLEAARMDGANPFQIFFRIMIPQIWTTILVVWTTVTIVVLKIFDIVLAMTNGQWDTEVLANLMYDWMFRGGGDSGRGSTIALIIMLAVVPIMIWNVRRLKESEAGS